MPYFGQCCVTLARSFRLVKWPLPSSQVYINQALDGLMYTPPLHAWGIFTFTTIANDNGYTGGGGARETTAATTISVTAVNDAPVIVAPALMIGEEDKNFTFTLNDALNISDVDALEVFLCVHTTESRQHCTLQVASKHGYPTFAMWTTWQVHGVTNMHWRTECVGERGDASLQLRTRRFSKTD